MVAGIDRGGDRLAGSASRSNKKQEGTSTNKCNKVIIAGHRVCCCCHGRLGEWLLIIYLRDATLCTKNRIGILAMR